MKRALKFPKGWDADWVRHVLDHYESQSEDEAAYETDGQTLMIVPTELVPEIAQLVAKRGR